VILVDANLLLYAYHPRADQIREKPGWARSGDAFRHGKAYSNLRVNSS